MMEDERLQDEQYSRKDFFISYAPADSKWAEWIAWQLENKQYKVTLDMWDFRPGSNNILELNKAVTETEHTIAVLSPHYVDVFRTQPEWTVAFKRDASGEQRRLIPVKVQPCEADGLFGAIEFINLVGKDEEAALDQLALGIKGIRSKPVVAPRFPGSKPQIVGIQLKNNPIFAGRERVLASVHTILHTDAIVALTGTLTASEESVGKTEVAKEYLYRYQSDYTVVLWIQDNPLDPSLAPFLQSIRNIAHELGLLVQDASDDMEVLFALQDWLNNHTDWFLILDGVKDLQTVENLLPPRRKGHVLLTTRDRAVASIAQLVELDKRTDEEKALSEKLAQLIDAALHSPNGEQHHLGPGDTTIGSAHDNLIILNDLSVASHHALITFKDGIYHITDRNSSHGTFVNGERIAPGIPHPLHQNDNIRIGAVLLAYGADATQLIHPALTSDIAQSQKSAQGDSLSSITDAQAILQQVRQGNVPDTWHVFRSAEYSFEDFRQRAIQLDLVFNKSFILLFFLTVTALPLIFALNIDNPAITMFVIVPILLVDLIAIAVFIAQIVVVINHTPKIAIDPPFPDALLVLTPDGLVEYVDNMHPTSVLSFADLINIQIKLDDNQNAVLHLSYFDEKEAEWSQRAHFWSRKRITQEIVEAFVHYQKQRIKAEQP